MSEEKERLRMEPEDEKEQDVEGHQFPTEMTPELTPETVAREDDDDDVEGHQLWGQTTPQNTP